MSVPANSNEEFLRLGNVTWQKLQTARLKEGFVEGKYQGEENALQEGFNDGYKIGFQASFQIAVLKGVVWALESSLKEANSAHASEATELKDEITKIEHMRIQTEKNKVLQGHCGRLSPYLGETDDDLLNPVVPLESHSSSSTEAGNAEEVMAKLLSAKQKIIKLLEESSNTEFKDLVCSI